MGVLTIKKREYKWYNQLLAIQELAGLGKIGNKSGQLIKMMVDMVDWRLVSVLRYPRCSLGVAYEPASVKRTKGFELPHVPGAIGEELNHLNLSPDDGTYHNDRNRLIDE